MKRTLKTFGTKEKHWKIYIASALTHIIILNSQTEDNMTEQTKKCQSCGNQMDLQADFCGSCGAKYEEVENKALSGAAYIEQEQIAPIPSSDIPTASAVRNSIPVTKMGFKGLYLSTNGRIGRNTYLLKGLLPILTIAFIYVIGVAGISALLQPDPSSSNALRTMASAVTCVLLLPLVAVIWAEVMIVVKRLHDLNHSGLMMLMWLIPIVGMFIGAWNAIEMIFASGTGPNKYGDYTF